jgi:DNA-binding transcriptional ArsR family regulator
MKESTLDLLFRALADPTRRGILQQLARGDAPVNELVASFSLSQPAISKHLRVLEAAGLITRGRDAQKRPCHLERETLTLACEWIEGLRVGRLPPENPEGVELEEEMNTAPSDD